MANVRDIHGTVFKNGSATLLARVVGTSGAVIRRSDVTAARYRVLLLDERDPDLQTPVAGHADVALDPAALVFDELQHDARWTVDGEGYNLCHVLQIGSAAAFPQAARAYRVQFELTPSSGPVILVRFRLFAI